MAIPFEKFVDITSRVGGVSVASNRELILRLLTSSSELPSGSVVEFESAAEVATYFGDGTPEALEAAFYFAFISKLTTKPTKISFAFWAEQAAKPIALGSSEAFVLSDFTAITTGSLTVTLGVDTNLISPLNFAPAASFADVATIMTTALQLGAGSQFVSALCTFNATRSRFEILGSAAQAAVMNITAGTAGVDVQALFGFSPPGVRLSDGVAVESITQTLTDSSALSNNFGSFAFLPAVAALTPAEILEAATWNDGENVKYMYLQRVLDTDAQTLFNSINLLSGTALTLYDGTLTPLEYPWLAPGMLMAATPYDRRRSVQNYMYQVYNLTPSVSTPALSTFYDGIRVNYYGVTQQAGAQVSFYQRGLLMGGTDDPTDMGVYANEVFLKDAMGTSIINLLLAVSAVPANATGIAQVLAAVQANIDQALASGIISVGKTFDATQRAFIADATGSDTAYIQLQNIGYWIVANITGTTPNFVVNYTLLYSKNDVVRKVEGSHTLI